MGQSSLTPTGIEKSNAIIFVCHVCNGGFNGASIHLREQCCLLALGFNNFV
jgi:hypothetical protein